MKQILGKVVVVADDGSDEGAVPSASRVELTDCGKVVERYLAGIPGVQNYVVMPNHVHMVISICVWPMEVSHGAPSSATTTSISSRIRQFKGLVTRHLGESIFQRSFHDRVIRNQQEYEKIWHYIEENPLRWELDRFYEP